MRSPPRAGRRAAPKPARDHRAAALLLTASLVLAGGWWLGRTPAAPVPATAADPTGLADLRRQFDAAVLLLHGRQYERAVTAWQAVLALAPRLPEAHANLGFALLGLQRPAAARAAFDRATELAPRQANAYYGLAMAWEASGDLAMATGAMRSYLHLARTEQPEHLARARAALWTWQQQRQRAASAPGAAASAGRELASRAAMSTPPAAAGPASAAAAPAAPAAPAGLPDSGNPFPPAASQGGPR